MAFVYGDRVKETSLTSGTGIMALGGPAVGFQSFSTGVGVGNECFYGIVNTTDDTWEMGRGTVGPGTLSRDTVISSTNSNLLVNFVAGQKVVYTTVPRDFFESVLDVPGHEVIDHTVSPFNLMDTTAHGLVDHASPPFSLLPTANLPTEHASIDHKAGPFNLLDSTAHGLINHNAAPLSLLDLAAHESVNHLAAPFSLLDEPAHNALPHSGLPYLPAGTALGKLVQMKALPVPLPKVAIYTGIPNDGSIPLVTEGTEVGSVKFTPSSSSNRIVTLAYSSFSIVFYTAVMVLFRDSTALAVSFAQANSQVTTSTHPLMHEQAAGTTSEIDYSLRFGVTPGAGQWFNIGEYGLSDTILIIMEIEP
jgi:hypothetical protein